MYAMNTMGEKHRADIQVAGNQFSGHFIEMRNIVKNYDGKTNVLDGVDFTLDHGEIASVMGPSGCGKSTFLNILGLLDTRTSGEYYLDGAEIQNSTVNSKFSAYRGDRIGFVFQSYYLIDSLSVYENIMMPFLYSNKGIPFGVDNIIDDYLDYFNLKKLKNKVAGLLSGGEKQRVALIRAMIKRPELLIADEPTGNLDEQNSTIVIRAFKEISSKGTAVVFVTHNSHLKDDEWRNYSLEEGRLKSVN